MRYTIYTDGACSGNPGPGGWGAVIFDQEKNQINISGKEENTTNNRMELTAPIMALQKPVLLICINQLSECIKHCFNRVLKSLTSALLNIKHL